MAKQPRTPSGRSPKEALADFFEGKGKGYRDRTFGVFSADEVCTILTFLVRDPNVVEDLVRFTRGHSRMARALTSEDVQAAMDELAVKEVMEA